jgi:hypothetical protein
MTRSKLYGAVKLGRTAIGVQARAWATLYIKEGV